ncbi:MAG: diphthamide biosynthesis enzyme Dph2 [Nanoarchaeota archaeon]
MQTHDFEGKRIIDEITRNSHKKVLLQLPEGLKKEATRLSNLIKTKTKAEVIVSGSSCWGSCDLAIEEAKSLNCDLIVHFGHAPFIKANFPILYIELKSNIDIVSIVKNNLKNLSKYKKIGLVSSVQYIHKLNEIKELLEKENKTVLIPKKKGFVYYDGHVIGCEYRHLKDINADCFLVIGNKFHALGAALTVNKDVLLLNETGKLENMNEERNKIIKQRAVAIEKTKVANKIGITISLKPGQKNLEIAKNIQKELEKQEKEAILITLDEITPSKLMSFYDIDAFIIIACPRIAIEDYGKYEKPIINSREANVLIGKLTWDDLLKGGFIGFV